MNLLAIDTSTEHCLVAVRWQGRIVESMLATPKQHTENILSMIDDLLGQLTISLSSIQALAVCIGPGSFVGIRVGVSVMQALGFAQNIPIVPLSSLAVIAQSAYRLTQSAQVAVLQDARMNQVYTGYYCANQQGVMLPISADAVTTLDDLIIPFSHDWVGVGNMWEKYSGQKAQEIVNPTGCDMCKQAEWFFNNQSLLSAMELEPLYLQGSNLWQKKPISV